MGDVGTGWSDAARAALAQRLASLEQDHSPFTRPIPRADAARARWVRPVLVGDVVYRQFIADGRLRHTAWRGERPDRDAADVQTPEPTRGR
ncbi:hypothetical protein [Amycolatopsis circi]|uniref:ATP dependent DNA ligase n=1 Tax=Amycolatopsis circi TaxID=871959 RepID=UPI001FCA0EE1|nr:hypothetical protein [Amycolatopsis circi]